MEFQSPRPHNTARLVTAIGWLDWCEGCSYLVSLQQTGTIRLATVDVGVPCREAHGQYEHGQTEHLSELKWCCHGSEPSATRQNERPGSPEMTSQSAMSCSLNPTKDAPRTHARLDFFRACPTEVYVFVAFLKLATRCTWAEKRKEPKAQTLSNIENGDSGNVSN